MVILRRCPLSNGQTTFWESCCKESFDVSGGGKKPFRQKGTGRARAGTTRAVHWKEVELFTDHKFVLTHTK